MLKRKITTSLLLALLLFTASASALLTPGFRKFNTGEVTPLLLARDDFVKYQNSCLQLQNMVPLSQGPVMRRPGTRFINSTKNHGVARLIPFENSKTDAYMLEFGNLYIRAYRKGGQVLDGGDAFEITTTYTTSELDAIQFVQSADIMWLVHPDHEIAELSRTGHTSWTLADEDLVTGPFMDRNTTATTITPSATTGSITLTASTAIFEADHVGAIWQIFSVVDNSAVNGSFTEVGNSDEVTVLKDQEYLFTTHGKWSGTFILQREYDNSGIWQDVTTRHYEVDGNLDFSKSEAVADAQYRVRMDSITFGTLDYNLEALTVELGGVVEITAFTSTTVVTGTVQSTLGNTTATTEWSEGYFGDVHGWPPTVEFHEERICYGGNADFPQTLWLSQTGDYNNFGAGTLAADAIIYSLPGQNPIQWMRSQEFLFVGTLGGAGRLGGNSPHDAISAEELPTYRQQSYSGSAALQAAIANDQILFVERGRREVSEFAFSIDRDKYVATDLTILSEHITTSGITAIAYQERPESILWCVTNDGVLLSLTYKRNQDVVAWARHVTGGAVESVAVMPGDEEDEVWVIVNRTIRNTTKRYVEQLQPFDWGTDQADMWFVDSGLLFDGGPAVNVLGITRADPAVVSVQFFPVDGDGDDLEDGDQVQIRSVVGMTEVNDRVYTISNPNVSARTFELRDSTDITDIDSTGFTVYTSGGTAQRVENTFGGLGHLESETVTVFADGGPAADETVTSSSISTGLWSNKVLVGLPYTSVLETMPIVFSGQQGSVMAKIKAIRKVTFDFYQTLGTEYGTDADNLRPINFKTTETPLSGRVPLFSGMTTESFQHGYNVQTTVYIQQDLPLPMTVRAIMPEIEIF
jgi:hypothetical protein